MNAAKFPTDQRLAQTSDLRLEIENTGSEQVPNLAVTIWTGDEKAGGSFSVRSDQPGLADPNRPVWILENGFPKLVDDRARTSPSSTGARPPGADVGADRHLRLRPARGRATARTSSGG